MLEVVVELEPGIGDAACLAIGQLLGSTQVVPAGEVAAGPSGDDNADAGVGDARSMALSYSSSSRHDWAFR